MKKLDTYFKILVVVAFLVMLMILNYKHNIWKRDFLKKEYKGFVSKIEFDEKGFLILYIGNQIIEPYEYGEMFKDKIKVGDSIVKLKDSYNFKVYRIVNDSVITVYW